MRHYTLPSNTHTIQANGHTHAFIESGEGPLVIMLHGFPDTPDTWSDLMPAVAAEGFRVVAPYLRGYAPSQIPTEDTTAETQGRDVLALIEALGSETAIVIGHDWGASAAYSAALLGPEKVSHLITLAIPHPGGIKPTLRLAWDVRHFITLRLPGAVKRFAANDYAGVDLMCRRWSPTWIHGPEEFESVKNAFSAPGCLDAALGYYRAIELIPPKWVRQKITVPTLCFSGIGDPVLGPPDFEKTTHLFTAGFEVCATPGGHFLHREDPQAILDRLLPYLRESRQL